MKCRFIYSIGFLIILWINLLFPVVANSETNDSQNLMGLEDRSSIQFGINESVSIIKSEQSKSTDNEQNVISKLYIMDSKGNPLDTAINTWESFRIYGDFKITNNKVKANDKTTLTLPDKITFNTTENFDIRDHFGNTVAHTSIDSQKKTIELTYTDFVETHSDISGNFFFYAKVDTTIVKKIETVPVEMNVNGSLIYAGHVTYSGEDEKSEEPLEKSGWVDSSESNALWYYLAINHSKQMFKDVTVTDILQFDNKIIDTTNFQILKGEWIWNTNKNTWELENIKDVTVNYAINWNSDGNGFSIKMGDIAAEEGFIIKYKVVLNYKPIDGEQFSNNAILKANKEIISEVSSQIIYQKGGGEAEGNTFKIILHKKNKEGKDLPNAEFEIFSEKNNKKIGTIITDSSGKGSLQNLLKDNYLVKEIRAPEGYLLSEEEIHIHSSEFDKNKEVYKEVFNKQKSSNGIQFRASKILIGKELLENEFNFALKNKDGTVLQDKTNDSKGYVYFDELTYDKAGIYEYTIQEVIGSQAGIVYDTHEIKAIVTVEDTNGKLEASVVYIGDKIFENSYRPIQGSIVLQANKVLQGKTLAAGAFDFELIDNDGKVIQTQTNDEEGVIHFDELSYDKVGTYKYTIQEVIGSQAGINYDKHKINVDVTVEDRGGELEACVVYTGNRTFENNYILEKNITNSSIRKIRFPDTGDQSFLWITITGICLLIVVNVFYLFARRRK